MSRQQQWWRVDMRSMRTYIGAFLVSAIFLFPLFSLIRASLMTRVDIYSRPFQFLPLSSITLQNYVTVLEPGHQVPVGPAIVNTFIVSISTAILNVLLASMAAYAFCRLTFRFKNTILSSLMSIYLFPGMIFLIPMFILMRTFNLWDTYFSLIIPYTAWNLPFMILLCKSYFESVPIDIEEAALVDGCSRLQVLGYIVIPTMAPTLLAVGATAFILSWCEFYTPLILTSHLKVVSTVMGMYSTSFETEISQMAAAAVLSILPVVILTLLLQKQIVGGITAGAVKGGG
jgi:multiple sugar transport system permease protein